MSIESRPTVEETINEVTKLNKWLLALFIVLLVFLVVETILIAGVLRQQPQADDIFDFPQQEVESRIPGVQRPAVRLTALDGDGAYISVTAEKCVDLDAPVSVRTNVSWDTLDPRGTFIEDWTGVEDLKPGCNFYEFTNRVPALVAARTLELIRAFPTLDCVVWQVVGVDTPLDPSLSPERWFTEPFCIYPPLETG